MGDLYLLDLAIIPDVLVIAFFSANSLLPVVCINLIQVWVVLTYGPHDGAITRLLDTAPLQIFSHVYGLQLVTAVLLYFWVRSTERALARADRAEEMAVCERKERTRQQQELERKQQLDNGIQQILQTHVAVANGDLNARAPLHQDHDLWQVARTLNNLIARLQSQNHTIHELKQQIETESDRTTGKIAKVEQATGQLVKPEKATGKIAKVEQATGKVAKIEQTTSQVVKSEQATGKIAKIERATDQLPKVK
jgi:methyl-accepting chemotaxis protein